MKHVYVVRSGYDKSPEIIGIFETKESANVHAEKLAKNLIKYYKGQAPSFWGNRQTVWRHGGHCVLINKFEVQE